MATFSSSGPSCRDLDNTMRVDAGSCRGGFDFTLLFEETILTLLPIALISIVVPFRMWQLSQERRKVSESWLLPLKLVSQPIFDNIGGYTGCEPCGLTTRLIAFLTQSLLQAAWLFFIGLGIAQTALWALPAADRTKASIATNAVLTVGALMLATLSYAEHTRSVRPSFILNIYLLCSLLFDIARARTLWFRATDGFNEIISIVTIVAVGGKLLLVILEAVEKRHILKNEFSGYPPEATAGFYNRCFFWWLNPLFKNGFSNVLSVEDLFVLDKELSSERLLAMFEERWSKGKKAACSP